MSQPALRLFVALSLPLTVREALGAWRAGAVESIDGLRAVAGPDLHVTLCFLGSVAADHVGDVVDACAVVRALPPADLTLGEPLWLPGRAPRVLAVALEDSGARLGAVQAALARSLAGAGVYRPEARPWLAHVTLARVRRGARMRPTALPAPEAVAFTGSTVTVYRSQLGRDGARYQALASMELDGGSG